MKDERKSFEGGFGLKTSFEDVKNEKDFLEATHNLGPTIIGSQREYSPQEIIDLFYVYLNSIGDYVQAVRESSNFEEIEAARVKMDKALAMITNGEDQGIRDAAERAARERFIAGGFMNEEGHILDEEGNLIESDDIMKRSQ